MEGVPRFLANDMFVRAESEQAAEDPTEELCQKVDSVIEETLLFIRSMGGGAQPHKCAILASDDKLRKKLRGETWPVLIVFDGVTTFCHIVRPE